MLENQALPMKARLVADELAPQFAEELLRIASNPKYAPRPRYLIESVLRDLGLVDRCCAPTRLGVLVVKEIKERERA